MQWTVHLDAQCDCCCAWLYASVSSVLGAVHLAMCCACNSRRVDLDVYVSLVVAEYVDIIH